MSAAAKAESSAPALPGLPVQVALLSRRLVVEFLRQPTAALPNLVVAVFLLLVYDGGLGGSAAVTSLVGGNYVNFILPVAVLSASAGGAAAGFFIVDDMERGYFWRQLAMPVSRTALVLAPMVLGALQVVAQTCVIIALGLVLGASPAAGVGGLLGVATLALVWGLGFAGYSVAAGMLVKNAQGTQAATLLMFPLIFLAPTFLPRSQLKNWIATAAEYNPTTYLLEGMRSLLAHGWEAAPLLKALAWGGGFAALALVAATAVARRTTSGD